MIQSSSLDVPYQVRFTNGPWSAVADVPKAKGGDGQGFGPHELVEAALAACLTMTAQIYARKHGFPLEGVAAEVLIDRNQPDEVVLVYSLQFQGPLSAEQERAMRAAASTCPVARTLSGKLACRSKEAEVGA